MKSRAFTLIELLVVISIISLLASIVISSLGSARLKGLETSIKSNLRSAINAQELEYDKASPNTYAAGSIAPAALSGMLQAIDTAGGTTGYYSRDGTRWAVSAKLDSNTQKNWSADGSSVVSWDTQDVNVSGAFVSSGVKMNWVTAVSACALSRGRLPTIEQLESLFLAHNSQVPTAFLPSSYWSNTSGLGNNTAYYINLNNNVILSSNKTSSLFKYYVRCVR
ncbi:MAG: prepilin-type N-terminal cleavage/methylation domain-containing protein [Candidatus Paceibacterota bacterium]|jgi:prepilin-type N-terminal cleavage/methylation domain-containing protein